MELGQAEMFHITACCPAAQNILADSCSTVHSLQKKYFKHIISV